MRRSYRVVFCDRFTISFRDNLYFSMKSEIIRGYRLHFGGCDKLGRYSVRSFHSSTALRREGDDVYIVAAARTPIGKVEDLSFFFFLSDTD